jgi:hypothetical protein
MRILFRRAAHAAANVLADDAMASFRLLVRSVLPRAMAQMGS